VPPDTDDDFTFLAGKRQSVPKVVQMTAGPPMTALGFTLPESVRLK